MKGLDLSNHYIMEMTMQSSPDSQIKKSKQRNRYSFEFEICKIEKEKNQICKICFTEIKNAEKVIFEKCDHTFCKTCIHDYLKF